MERMSRGSKNSPVMAQTKKHCDFYAAEGLRTLFLAERVIEEEDFQVWYKGAQNAKLATKDREEVVAAEDEKIEVGLELIGSTAIEDRLQDEVADTIRFMKRTGIKVWVLTGDKVETAINIGFSAGLLETDMVQYLIDGTDHKTISAQLSKTLDKINRLKNNKGVPERQAND